MNEKIKSPPFPAEPPEGRHPKESEYNPMRLPPGIRSLEDPVTESLREKLIFYYKVKKFREFLEQLAAGRTIEELTAEDPSLKLNLKEWKALGLISDPPVNRDSAMPPIEMRDSPEADFVPPLEPD